MILARLAGALREQNWLTVVVEILVVVVGIVLALQVDNWNSNANERNLEQLYLQRLAEDIQGDMEGFRNLREIFKNKHEFIDQLKTIDCCEQIRLDPNLWVRRLRYSLFVSLPSIRSATFDELAGSGRLAIIQDMELRASIAEYYAEYALMSRILAEPIGEYKRLVYESFPGALHYSWQTRESITNLEDVLEGYEKLLARPGFVHATNAESGYAGDLVLYSGRFIERSEQLLAMLATNIKK